LPTGIFGFSLINHLKNMKKLCLIITSLIFAGILSGQQWIDNLPQGKIQNGDLTFYEIQKAFNDYWDPLHVANGYYKNEKGEEIKAYGWKQFRRWEYYWENRIVKETGQFPKTSASEELEKYLLENPRGKSANGNWTSLGPNSTSGGYAGLGRLNCVGFVSGDNNSIYVGSPAGGIWKTANGGTSWTPIGDNNAVIGVSDIVAYRPASAPDVIYIATGDRDGGSMWSLGGGQYNDNNSVGVLKSTDGGTTWNTTGLSFTASQQRTVNRLLIHPSDNNTLYAATSVGVYKTTNGGTNWTQITSNVFIDMEFKPGTPATIYGSNLSGDIYRSTNDGSIWTQTLSTSSSRTELAVSANNSAIVYAVLADGNSGLAGIYKSTDSGASFSQVFSGATTNLLNWDCNSTTSGGQGWYDLCIAADPTNVNNVFVGGVNTWKSTNGGTVWSISSHWSGGCSVQAVHADKHCLAYQNGTSTLFEGNDGGFYKTANNGSSWTHLGGGLITSQIYRLGVAQTVSNENIIGLQDNGTKSYLSGSWSDELGGDGFECAIDYTNQNTLYGELYYGDIRRSTNHGSGWSTITSGLSGSAHWCTPFVIDPNVNTTLYIGYQDVWKSTNQGSSWTQISTWAGSTLKSLAVAPSNSGYIYAATSSILYRTTNGGTSWSNITGTIPVGSGDITYICVKNNDPNTVWVSLGGYNTTRVYQTINGGTSWTNISTGLPSIPIMCLVQNKQNTSQVELYAGTDVGVYVKAGSANWVMFSNGLPNVVVTELEIYYNTNIANSRIRAATFGRGLWQSDLFSTVPPPVANFSANNTTPNIGQTVSFTDLSTNTPTSWSWSFSPATVTYVGGTTSASQNPQVQFTAGGSYSVTLTATNAGGSDPETKNNYVSVFYAPVANFSANNLTPAIGQTVTFTDLSTYTPTSWVWSFNPATVIYVGGTTSASQNPQVQFTSGGPYTVTLTATNASGSNTLTKSDYITVSEWGTSTATLSLQNVSATAPGEIAVPLRLDAISSNLIVGMQISFYYNPTYVTWMGASSTPENGISYINPALTPLGGDWLWNSLPGNLIFSWIDPTYNGVSVAPGNLLVFRFNYLGGLTFGQSTPLTFSLTLKDAVGKEEKIINEMTDENFQPYFLTLVNGIILNDGVKKVNLKVFLEGPYNGTEMTPKLTGVLPLNQPYNVSPWNYNGSESVSEIPAVAIDWILVELRDAAAPEQATSGTRIGEQAGFLRNDGKILDHQGNDWMTFNNMTINNNLYVVIHHRNHLSIMSSIGLTANAGLYSYDFSTGATQAYGGTSAHKQIGPGVWGMMGGDGNRDGSVTISDKSPIWESQSGTHGYLDSDYNLDTQSDNKDKDNIWAPNLGKGNQVPN
jgi:PKD repeat protein